VGYCSRMANDEHTEDRVILDASDGGWPAVATGSPANPGGGVRFSTGRAWRIERGAPGRIGRLVIEAEDYILDTLAAALRLSPAEAPPVHELEARIAALEKAAEARPWPTEMDSLLRR